MENSLERSVNEVAQMPDVKSAMCIDQNGLLLVGSQGARTSPLVTGSLTAVCEKAKLLDPSSPVPPVVSLEAANSKVILQSRDKHTIVIYK